MKRTLSGFFAAAAFVVVTAVPVPAQVVLPPIPVPPVPEQLSRCSSSSVRSSPRRAATRCSSRRWRLASWPAGSGSRFPSTSCRCRAAHHRLRRRPVVGPTADMRRRCRGHGAIKATSTALGAPLPVVVRTVGPVIEEFLVIHDKLPPPASTAGLDELAIGTLQCTAAGAEAIPPDPGVPPSTSRPPRSRRCPATRSAAASRSPGPALAAASCSSGDASGSAAPSSCPACDGDAHRAARGDERRVRLPDRVRAAARAAACRRLPRMGTDTTCSGGTSRAAHVG